MPVSAYSFRMFFRPLMPCMMMACLVIAGCVSTPLPIRHDAPQYGVTPQALDVAEIMVLNDGNTTELTRQLAAAFGQSPEGAIRDWAAHRVQAAGTQGSFTIVLKEANFFSQKLPVKSGLKSYFERQQAERWDAYINVMLAVEGGRNMLPPAEITINARASQTLPENASEEEKRQTYHSILNKLMQIYDAEAKKHMDEFFRAYYL